MLCPIISGYYQTFKNKDGDEDKNKTNKVMSFRLDGDRLLEKYKPFGLILKTCKVLNLTLNSQLW